MKRDGTQTLISDASVIGNTPATHAGNGGSIPAASLYWHCDVEDAKRLVLQHHYSKRWPSNVQYAMTAHLNGGLFGHKGEAVAAVVWSIPPTRWSEEVLELSRLVRTPKIKLPLTALIAASVRKIHGERKFDLLVSFADSTQGHEGFVYRAAGWNYGGMRKPRMDGIIVDGLFITGRNANHKWGTQSPERLAEMGIKADPHFDTGKHLYWKALTEGGKQKAIRLGLQCVSWKTNTEART